MSRFPRFTIMLLALISLMISSSACNTIFKTTGSRDDSKTSGITTSGTPKSETGTPSPAASVSAGYELMKDGAGISCNDIPALTDDVLEKLKKAGFEYIKIHVPYPFDADGSTITTNYMHVKLAAKKITEHGLKVLGQSFTPGGNRYDSKTGTIGWFSNLPNVYSDFNDPYFYKIARAGSEYIARDLKKYISQWLVSNEPDINVFTGSMSPDQIANYIFACAEGLDAGNPGVNTGVNLFVSVNPLYSLQLTEKLYKKDSPLDFLGLDSYFGTLVEGSPESWTHYIDQFSKASGVPIVITEWSYSSAVYNPSAVKPNSGLKYNSDVCRNKKFSFEWAGHTRNQETQTDYINVCMKIFAENPAVIGSFWFCIQDFDGPCWECGDVMCPMNSSWGVLNSDNTAKPALDAFTKSIKQYYGK